MNSRIRWLGGLQGRRTAVTGMNTTMPHEIYFQKEEGYLGKRIGSSAQDEAGRRAR